MLRKISASLLLVAVTLAGCGQGKRNQRSMAAEAGAAADSMTPLPEGGAGGTTGAGGSTAASGGSAEPAAAGEAGSGDQPPLFEPPQPLTGPTWTTPMHVAFTPEPTGFLCSGAIVGDLDADGFDELVLLDHSGYELQPSYTAGVVGAAYLFYGRTGWPAQLSVANADLIVRGATAVAGLGDIDGDGFDDAAISSDCDCDGFATNAYCVCDQVNGLVLLFGGPTRYTGEARADMVGQHLLASTLLPLAGVGDLNGDGFADLRLGGSLLGGAANFHAAPPDLIAPPYSVTGPAWGLGDVDADGFDELMLTVENDWRLTYGAAERLESGFAPALASFEAAHDLQYGSFPAPLGDLDGDGHADLGLPGTLDLRLLYGSPDRFTGASDTARRDASLITQVGQLASIADGDFNGDGARDLLLGVQAGQTGRLLIVAGSGARLVGDHLVSKAYAIANDTSHFAVADCLSGSGDVNADGFDDVTVGAEAGSVWLVRGGPFDN